MSNTNILELPIATGLSGSEYIPLVQGSGSSAVTRRAAASLFAGFPVTSMQLANVVYAGPSSGSAAAPVFRAIVADDLPVVPVSKGGTSFSSYAVGDILYADTTSSLAKLADVATGNALISGGVGVAPAWGKIGLTTHVSGVLPVANGGTGGLLPVTSGGTGTSTAFTTGSVVFAGASGVYSQDNTNLFWDDTNNRLGVRNNSPQYTLDVGGTGAVFNTYLRVWTNDISNTFIGYGVGANIQTPPTTHSGDGNTLIGSGVASVATTIFATTIVGGGSGNALTTGDSNTIFGYQNGVGLTTGKWNVLIGVDCIVSDTDCANMVVIGHHAGINLTFAANQGECVVIGAEAIHDGVGGVSSVIIGYRAGYNSAAASVGNTYVGHLTGFTNTDGTLNTGVGKEAMFSTTTGQSNGAFGYRPLWNLTSGNNNCAFGNFAGFTVSTGNSNVFFGNNAGFYETGSSKLYVDNTSRASEADGRAKALVYGVFDAAIANQLFRVNGQLIGRGTGTNDNAAAGEIGEIISTSSAYPGTGLTTATAANIASVSLTAGDWDVCVDLNFEPGATTSLTQLITSLSATSATLDTNSGFVAYFSQAAAVPVTAISQSVGSTRVSLASTTTYYAVARGAFTVSTLSAWGIIRARRVR